MKGLQKGVAALLCTAMCWGVGGVEAGGVDAPPNMTEIEQKMWEGVLHPERRPQQIAPTEQTYVYVLGLMRDQVPNLADYPKLETLKLDACDQAQFEALLAQAQGLSSLVLSDCDDMTDLSPVLKLPRLTSLDLRWDEADWSVLAGHPTLRELHLGSSPLNEEQMAVLRTMPALEMLLFPPGWAEDLTPLRELKSLKGVGFSIQEGQSLPSLAPLASLPLLKSFAISSTFGGGTAMLTEVATLSGLQELAVHGLYGDADLLPLTSLQDLQALTLGFTETKSGSDLRPLGELPKLRSLELFCSPECKNTLPELPALEVLSLDGIMDAAVFQRMPALKELSLRCEPGTDLGALKALPALERLSISVNMPDDLTPLYELPTLTHLVIRAHTLAPPESQEQLAELSRACPELTIMFN